MNTLLPNLNAAPLPPSAGAARNNFQADPQPGDQSQSSFTSAMAKADADRTAADNANQVRQNQNAAAAQNAQDTQNAQNAQNAADAQSAQDAQAAAQSAQNSPDNTTPVTAKKDDKDSDKTKSAKDAAASDADKTSTELLALVANSKLTSQQAAAPVPVVPVTAPVTAHIERTGASALADTDSKGTAGNDALTNSLPDAWNAAAGKGKPDAGSDATAVAADKAAFNNPADAAKAAVKDAATGKTDAANAQATGAKSAPIAAVATAKTAGPDLQAPTAANNNAIFNPGLQQIAASTTPAAAGAAGDKLTPAVGSADWDQALGQKMVWMTGNGQQTATLTLNPKDLGPMQVVINVNKTQADATFIASNPEVKQALEAAMPKLREMMDQAGIQLGQTNVSTGMPNQNQQAFNQPQGSGNSGNAARGGNGNGGVNGQSGGAIGTVTPAAVSSSGQGLVDTFV